MQSNRVYKGRVALIELVLLINEVIASIDSK